MGWTGDEAAAAMLSLALKHIEFRKATADDEKRISDARTVECLRGRRCVHLSDFPSPPVLARLTEQVHSSLSAAYEVAWPRPAVSGHCFV